MIEMRWLKYEASRQSPFGPRYKLYYQTKRLQYRYWVADAVGGHWSGWLDVPTVEVEAEEVASAK